MESRMFMRHRIPGKYMRPIAYPLYLMATTILLSELTLRLMGHEPGIFQSFDGFQPVDSLYEFRNYTTDDHGIYLFSPWVTDSLPKYYQPPHQGPLSDKFSDYVTESAITREIDWEADHLNRILLEYTGLWLHLTGKDNLTRPGKEDSMRYHTALPNAVRSLLSRSDGEWSAYDSLLLRYAQYPFNSDGFRSIAFTNVEHTGPRILLVGDSFTYGESARPFYNSYADILLGQGYLVYNAGISGMDPAQYMAVVKKYVPLLEPDIVVVAFCLHNDMMRTPRTPAPDRPHEYITNAGFFYSNPQGEHLSLYEAYEFYKELCIIPASSLFNRICAKTALTTKIWGVLHHMYIVKHPKLDMLMASWSGESAQAVDVTSRYLDEIGRVCNDHDVPMLLALVPDITRQDDPLPLETFGINNHQVESLMTRYPHVFPDNFDRSDFADGEDIHFNNKGSMKFAEFIDSLVHVILSPVDLDSEALSSGR